MWLQIPDRPEVAGEPRRRMNRARLLGIVFIVITAAAVLIVGLRLWTAGPDTVRVTITRHTDIDGAPDAVSTIFDRSVHDAALAQQLQRDLAALPIEPPLDPIACPQSREIYDTYTLTWSRSGLFVEQAYANATGCQVWIEDGVIARLPRSNMIYLDMHAALGAPLPPDVTAIFHDATHLPRSDTIFVDMHTLLGAPLPPCFRAPTCRPG